MNTLAARNALVVANLSLATVLAKRAKARFPPSIELDDLISEATIGLIEAAAKYDPASPVYFRVYAWRRVWGAMMDAHRRRHWVNDTHEELPADSGASTAKAFGSFHAGRRYPSDGTFEVGHKSGRVTECVSKEPHPDIAIDCKRSKRALAEVIEMLPPQRKAVVLEYYGHDVKNRAIAEQMGLREERVGEIHRGALVEMKRGLVARGIVKAA